MICRNELNDERGRQRGKGSAFQCDFIKLDGYKMKLERSDCFL